MLLINIFVKYVSAFFLNLSIPWFKPCVLKITKMIPASRVYERIPGIYVGKYSWWRKNLGALTWNGDVGERVGKHFRIQRRRISDATTLRLWGTAVAERLLWS
ncbi:a2.2 [Tranosema rostrale ichnovirus]|nr:a2.2 [Tranosema rostrale ichnovirus]